MVILDLDIDLRQGKVSKETRKWEQCKKITVTRPVQRDGQKTKGASFRTCEPGKGIVEVSFY